MKKFFILLIGVALASAFTIRDPATNKAIQVTIDGDLDAPMPNPTQPMWEITIGRPTESHSLKTCWVRVWVVKFCTFVIPDQLEAVDVDAQIEDISNGVEPLRETESCDQLGCQMFCKKNHFKRGVCHKKGCECDFE